MLTSNLRKAKLNIFGLIWIFLDQECAPNPTCMSQIEVEWQGLKDEIRDGVLEENLPIDNGIIDFIIKQVKILNLSEIDVKTLVTMSKNTILFYESDIISLLNGNSNGKL